MFFLERKKAYISLLLFLNLIINQSTIAAPVQSYFSLTLSILSYSKWNSIKTPTICIVENSEITEKFINYAKSEYKIIPIKLTEVTQMNCQVLYFQTQPSTEQQKILSHNTYSSQILIFTVNDSACESNSAFCLYEKNKRMRFNINLDVLSRSKVHIDPRILLLARTSE